MTTAAYRDGELAFDSAATDESCMVYVRKGVRLPGGDVAAGCGDLREVTASLSWLAKGGKGEPPAMSSASILFTDKGEPYLAAGGWPGTPIKGFCAIGSGSQGAMVGMKLGLSARDAVAAVIGIDHFSGGEIEVLAYEPTAARTPNRAGKPGRGRSPRKA